MRDQRPTPICEPFQYKDHTPVPRDDERHQERDVSPQSRNYIRHQETGLSSEPNDDGGQQIRDLSLEPKTDKILEVREQRPPSRKDESYLRGNNERNLRSTSLREPDYETKNQLGKEQNQKPFPKQEKPELEDLDIQGSAPTRKIGPFICQV